MATIGTWLYTFINGQEVGRDEFGNRYFRHRITPKYGRRKRWVLYKGMAEPSKVPPAWHGWLHYTTDDLPSETSSPTYTWEKEHLPNLTGTVNAYMPPGHVLKGAHRARTTSDYQPWRPKDVA